MKKVWKYLILTILLLLGLCCVGVLYLFFVPGSSLFNITYIYKSKTIEKTESVENVNKVVLNTRGYNVNIFQTDKEDISLKVYANSFGFTLKQHKEATLTTNFKDNILTLTIDEPYGFATKNNSYINLYLPTSNAFDLTLNNKSAKTKIDAEDLVIYNLTYKTESGDCSLNNAYVLSDIVINSKDGDFKVGEKVKTNNNNVFLSLNSALFEAKTSSFNNVSILKNNRGVVKINSCNSITEKITNAGGQIYINKAKNVNIVTSGTDLYFDEILDGAFIDMSKSGDINITKLYGPSTLSTKTGKINIGTAYSAITTTTDTGNINIGSAYLKITAKTNYGDVNINFAEDASSINENSNSRKLEATLKNGKINATGVENISLTITDNARAIISMKNVLGANKIIGNRGNINVTVEKTANYVLKTETKKGKVRVNLSQIVEYNGYTTKTERVTNVNCETSQNSLTVSTINGNLTILDTNFA